MRIASVIKLILTAFLAIASVVTEHPAPVRPVQAATGGAPASGAFGFLNKFGGPIGAFTMTESRAFVQVGERLAVFDLDARSPRGPISISTDPVPGHQFLVRGDTLFAFARDTLETYDVRNPGQPVHMVGYSFSAILKRMALRGDYIYAVGSAPNSVSEIGVRIIHIADPLRPREVGLFPLLLTSDENLTVDDRFVYVFHHSSVPRIPNTPATKILAALSLGGPEPAHVFAEVAVSEDATVLSAENGRVVLGSGRFGARRFLLWDLRNPDRLMELFADVDRAYQEPMNATLLGERLFVRRSKVLDELDISDPEHPVMVRTLPVDEGTVFKSWGRVFLGIYSGSVLKVMVVPEQGNPFPVIEYVSPNALRSLAAIPGYLFLAGAGGLYTVDVRDVRRPVLGSTRSFQTAAAH